MVVKTRSKKIGRNNRHTKKRYVGGVSANEKMKIAKKFLEILDIVKLYHWKTNVFAQHKASDELHEKLSSSVDLFIEALMGKYQKRIKSIQHLIQREPIGEKSFKKRIFAFRDFLVHLDKELDSNEDTDVLSIRDTMLADVNQFLYLMTFDR
jgi:hypothetical protein